MRLTWHSRSASLRSAMSRGGGGTVSIRIQIPEDAALASLRVQPVPGWTATLTTSDLEVPIESHGQEISSYVGRYAGFDAAWVLWTARVATWSFTLFGTVAVYLGIRSALKRCADRSRTG